MANSLTPDLKAVWGVSETLAGQEVVLEAEHDVLANCIGFLRQHSCYVEGGKCCTRSRIFDDLRQLSRVNFHGVLAVDQGDWRGQNTQKVVAVLDKGRDMQGLRQVCGRA